MSFGFGLGAKRIKQSHSQVMLLDIRGPMDIQRAELCSLLLTAAQSRL